MLANNRDTSYSVYLSIERQHGQKKMPTVMHAVGILLLSYRDS